MVEAVLTPLINVWRVLAIAAVCAVLSVWARPAAATVVVHKDFAALCRDADLIFVGTVQSVESRWSDAGRTSIETLVTFADLDWLQGDPQSSITLRFAGGAVDGVRMEIAGVPKFAAGERRVIFAYDGTFVSPIVGFDQGAPRVVDGSDGPMVVDNGTSLRAADGARGALRLGEPSAGDPTPLDEYLDRVRDRLGAESDAAP